MLCSPSGPEHWGKCKKGLAFVNMVEKGRTIKAQPDLMEMTLLHNKVLTLFSTILRYSQHQSSHLTGEWPPALLQVPQDLLAQ